MSTESSIVFSCLWAVFKQNVLAVVLSAVCTASEVCSVSLSSVPALSLSLHSSSDSCSFLPLFFVSYLAVWIVWSLVHMYAWKLLFKNKSRDLHMLYGANQ